MSPVTYGTPTLQTGPPVGLATAALIRDKIINHVVIVVDASGSMSPHVSAVRAQLRTLIEDLAEQSKVMDQETRVTIYAFATEVRVLAFDVDVLRLPPVWDTYDLLPGRTALNDATVIGLDDLATTSTLYGDHGFLFYVLTDGKENDSRRYDPEDAARRIGALSDNWTVAALVPDPQGRRYAESLGVPPDNIQMWNAQSRSGFVDAGVAIRAATSNYMQGRASGVRGTRTLFSTGADAVNRETVSAALASGDLQPLHPDSFVIIQPTSLRDQIRPVVETAGLTFKVGTAFYELTRRVEIHNQKNIIVVEKRTGRAFWDPTTNPVTGSGSPKVRQMIGLPSMTTKVSPDHNPDFWIFVQSTSTNRIIEPGDRVLVLK